MPATKGPQLRKESRLLSFPIMFFLKLYFLNYIGPLKVEERGSGETNSSEVVTRYRWKA